MKGLDGIQGPIYVGTGCVFRRQALYGYDAPVKQKPPGKTCNCWPKWCCLCCGSRGKKGKGKGKNKSKQEKRKKKQQREASTQIHALENIEVAEGESPPTFPVMFYNKNYEIVFIFPLAFITLAFVLLVNFIKLNYLNCLFHASYLLEECQIN